MKLLMCLNKQHIMKAYWGAEVQLHALLISALNTDGQLNAPADLSRKRDHGNYYTADWEGLDV